MVLELRRRLPRGIGRDGSARDSAGVCWHSVRPPPRGGARIKVVPRRGFAPVLEAERFKGFFVSQLPVKELLS